MAVPGARNLITDVVGVEVGHADDPRVDSGVTVLAFGQAWTAAVDVRGGAPGTRETEVLAPENLVGAAHAVVLSGGSVFGLGAADGVAAELSARGIGLELHSGAPRVPIVPCAVLYDLANTGDKNWGRDPPYRALGVRALQGAGTAPALGAVGAGRGAMAGILRGGIGSASLQLEDGLVVGALAAVNSVGSAMVPGSDAYWAWPFELDGEFGGRTPPCAPIDTREPIPDDTRLSAAGRLQAGVNTTLGVIACNAALSTAECRRMAMMAQDGLARALRPAHTPFDGDTIFAVASGARVLGGGAPRARALALLGAAAADCMARAIARGVHESNRR